MIAKGAIGLACDRQQYAVRLDDGPRVPARAVIIATGAEYRRPGVENLLQFEGAGVYYAATPMEGQLCMGDDVIVGGGGNAAGQAAVFLAPIVKRVHMLVRGDGLATRCRAISFAASRRTRRSSSVRTPRSSPCKETGISSGSDGVTPGAARSRSMSSGTCS